MKYLITESQLDRVIFRYLDIKNFIQIKKGATIFLVNLEDDEYAEIRYDKISGWCYIVNSLINVSHHFYESALLHGLHYKI
jgi:hypothetical protein